MSMQQQKIIGENFKFLALQVGTRNFSIYNHFWSFLVAFFFTQEN